MYSGLIFFVFVTSVMSMNDQCDEKIFILISSQNILLVNFESRIESSPSIIYQTKSNTTIENGLFSKRTNTIVLLLNQWNETYSIRTLNVHDNLNRNWIEKTNKFFYSSYIHLALGQRYLYLLNNQTMLLQTLSLPLTSTVYKQNYLLNLPKNQRILTYLVDETYQFLWILFEHYQYQLYICQLKTYVCQLYTNIFNLNRPIQLLINWSSQQLYFYSKDYLIIFQYTHNQTDYSIHYLNSSQPRFLTLCERHNSIEYISINYRQVCYSQTCQDLGNHTNRIHTIQRLSSSSNIFYCSKQRRIGQIVLMILILIEIAIICGAILWFGYKYISQSSIDKPMNSGTIWTSEKEFITHF